MFKNNLYVKIPTCFVASVVYGDENAPEVETLRQIRDNSLAENYLGKRFINFYYSGAGEKAAQIIKDNIPFTIPLIRKSLDLIVQKKKN